MTSPIVLTSAMRANLLAVQRTGRLVDQTTLRLSTGLDVSSALDNPQNFFAARALGNRANDLARLLDGIDQGIRTIEEASHGVTAIERLLNQADTIAQSRLEALLLDGEPPLPPAPTALDTQILAANPAAYWRLNETAGGIAANLGSIGGAVNGTYQNSPTLGSGALYDGGDTSTRFDGTNQSVAIPDSTQINLGTQPLRTVELVFNADTTIGRQVLYEEGGTVNSLSIYIDNGLLYVNGRDNGAWGPTNISAPIVAGQTYHVAFTFDSTTNEFIGYIDGQVMGSATTVNVFPSHSGNIGIGRMSQDMWFHDGPQSGNGFYFDGRISDVALYNVALDATTLSSHADAVLGTTSDVAEDEEFNAILAQITQIAKDATYRGIGLLDSDNLETIFNETGSSSLLSKGVDFTAEGLGIQRSDFNSIDDIRVILEDIRKARARVRQYGHSLATELNILSMRKNFASSTINTLKGGADDLTLADTNEEGANLLALQTQQQLGVTSMSIAGQSAANVLDLFA